jgi:hypothetical protein
MIAARPDFSAERGRHFLATSLPNGSNNYQSIIAPDGGFEGVQTGVRLGEQ